MSTNLIRPGARRSAISHERPAATQNGYVMLLLLLVLLVAIVVDHRLARRHRRCGRQPGRRGAAARR